MVDAPETEMPERIWAGDFDDQGFGHCVAGMQGGLYEEYIRADIAERENAELRAEVDRLTRSRDGYVKDCVSRAHEMERLTRQLAEANAELARKDEATEKLRRQVEATHPNHKTMFVYVDDLRAALSGSGDGWRDVEKELPPTNQVVIVRRASGYDGSDVYSWGARVDDGEGWCWGEHVGYGGGIRPDQDAAWNSIEADDDYRVTHWQPLPAAPAQEVKK